MNMENLNNLNNQDIQEDKPYFVHEPTQFSNKSRSKYFVFGLVILLCFVVLGFGSYYLDTHNHIKKSNTTRVFLPTDDLNFTKKPVPSQTIPRTQLTPVKSISETVLLKVAAIGGGIKIDGYNFIFTFNKEPNDMVTLLKRDENEYKDNPDFPQGAIDEGFVINHENDTLKIIPTFENIGSPLMQKLTPVIISNAQLTDGPIFRLKAAEINESKHPGNGIVYTTQYKDKSEDCAPWGAHIGQLNPPACILGGAHVLSGDNALTISCSAADSNANWCDAIVQSLHVSASKYTN